MSVRYSFSPVESRKYEQPHERRCRLRWERILVTETVEGGRRHDRIKTALGLLDEVVVRRARADDTEAEIARLRAEAGDYLRPDVRQAARMAMEERGRLRSELRATEEQMEVFREERDAARAEIARIESHYREAIKAGDWARAEATEAKGRAVVAETHLRKARAELETLRREYRRTRRRDETARDMYDAAALRTEERDSARAEIARLRAALSRHTCQHAECSDPETHAGCHAKMVLDGRDGT